MTMTCAYCGIPVETSPAGYHSSDGTDDRAAIVCDESPDRRHSPGPGTAGAEEFFYPQAADMIPAEHDALLAGRPATGQCAYCGHVARLRDLETFNLAGNLACRDTVACGCRADGNAPVRPGPGIRIQVLDGGRWVTPPPVPGLVEAIRAAGRGLRDRTAGELATLDTELRRICMAVQAWRARGCPSGKGTDA